MPDLGDIPIDKLAQYQQRALVRLHLKLTGETHRLLNEYLDKLRARLLVSTDEEGKLAMEAYFGLVGYTGDEWRQTFTAWRRLFEAARWEAAAIPFGSLARLHEHFMSLATASLPESRQLAEQGPRIGVRGEPVFDPQLQAILDAANERIYGDGFKLSGRIWRLDQESLTGIQRTLAEGLTSGDSAWNVAKKLEEYLGPGADCPRWTSTRLYKLTKSDVAAGDERGLIRGNPCQSKGVAYNALRLARNEVQIAHHMATDVAFERMPWVEKEQVRLSPSHPDIGCACEDIVIGGEEGDGVYRKGEIALPIHVQCLCYKVAVLMDEGDFVRKMRGWVQGTEPWAEMDDYAFSLGANAAGLAATSLTAMGAAMARWLWADEDELDDALGAEESERPEWPANEEEETR
jgi:hypothetical protein